MASKVIVSPSPLSQLLQGSGFSNADAWNTAAMDSLATPKQRGQSFNINGPPLNTPTLYNILSSPTTSFPALDLNKQKSNSENIFDIDTKVSSSLPTPTISTTPTQVFREIITTDKKSNNPQRFIARSEDVKTYKDHSVVTKTQIEVVPNKPKRVELPKLELPSPATVCHKMKLEYKPVTVKLETPEQPAPDSNDHHSCCSTKPKVKKAKTLKEKKFQCTHLKKRIYRKMHDAILSSR